MADGGNDMRLLPCRLEKQGQVVLPLALEILLDLASEKQEGLEPAVIFVRAEVREN